jgi:hypothetical protein
MVGIRDDLRLALDRVAFARACGIEPDDWQQDLLRSSSKAILLNCSRQSGKSTMAALIALHRALYYPGSLILCVAPALRQSQELFGKVLASYRDLNRPVQARSEGKLNLELMNASRILSVPGTEKTVRGFSAVDVLVIDEATLIDDSLYYAVRPMLAVSGGTLMMLATPQGRHGVFYEAWMRGSDWERYEIPATECPRLTPDYLERERMDMGEAKFQREFMCQFISEEGQFFSEDAIQSMLARNPEDVFFTPVRVLQER